MFNALMVLLALILLNQNYYSAFSLSLSADTHHLPFDGFNIGEVHTQSANVFDDHFNRIDRRDEFPSRFVSKQRSKRRCPNK